MGDDIHRRMTRVIGLVVAVVVLGSANAHAASVFVSQDQRLAYVAGPGESNALVFNRVEDPSRSPFPGGVGYWEVSDPQVRIEVGPGCALPDDSRVWCDPSVVGIYIDLGDGNDSEFVRSRGLAAIPATVLGGPGDDMLNGAAHADLLDGGEGNDGVNTGPDPAYGGSGGTDTIRGGPGNDELRGGVDGDTISGGPGNDTLSDDAGANRLSGDEGDDVVGGGGTLDGGPGADRVISGRGGDMLTGGPGPDSLEGNLGNDRFEAIDGEVDTIACGFGADAVRADPGDALSAGDCEAVTRASPAAATGPVSDRRAPQLTLRAAGRQRSVVRKSVLVTATCDEPCTLRATGRVRGAGAGVRLFPAARAVPPGTHTLRLAMFAAARRAVSAALRRGRRVVARVTVTASDGSGNRTTRTIGVRVVRR